MQIANLMTIVRKPALYEKGNACMWQDEYISRHLLELHLNPDSDAASRRHSTIDRTVQWIGAHMNTAPGAILDLGCGPGLYCERLAEYGHRVTGVDFSNRSIAYARQNAARRGLKIEYIVENYLDLVFENQFDLVMMVYCDFDVLVPDERALLLKMVHRALRPGGLFIFDTLNPNAPAAMNVPCKSWEIDDGGFWKMGPYLVLSDTIQYEEAQVILQQHIVSSEPDQHSVYRFWTHYYQHDVLVSILEKEGFSVEEARDDLLPDDGQGTHDMVTFYTTRKR